MAAWSSLSVPQPGPRTAVLVQRLVQLSTLVRIYLLLKISLRAYRHLYAYGIVGTSVQAYSAIKNFFVGLLLRLPSARREVTSELAKVRADLVAKLAPTTYPEGVNLTNVREIPATGRDLEWLRSEWANLHKLEHSDVDEGRVSGAVYHGGNDLSKVIAEASSEFLLTNPLHPDVFPGVRKMEAELVSMVLKLFHGEGGAGTTTSGGTESILMSVKTHRDWARATKGITEPEMVVPASAHAAFFKAAQYFCIKIHTVPVNPQTRQVEPKHVKRFINANTIMIVGSAPNFPDGMVDPIPELGRLAVRYNIGLHVDCCLGSFIITFAERAGLAQGIPKFDFQVPGVSAISCDTHKYGFCPKGSSIIMYRSEAFRRFQYFSMPEWAGGVYASPSMAGSRPGSIIAGAWATVNYIGLEGYTKSCEEIIGAARHFTAEIRKNFVGDLYILGDPQLSVVAFSSKTLSIYSIGDAMSKRGWHLNGLADPPALHMAFTRLSGQNVDKLLSDLAEVVELEKKTPTKDGTMVALYGAGQTVAGPYVVDEVAKTFIDVLYV